MRPLTLIVSVVAIYITGFALSAPVAPAVARQPETIVLGGKEFAGPYGKGWGTERPSEIYNGGDTSGLITDVRWSTWGGPVASGWGKNAIFKPHGGYYRHPIAIKLRASTIGQCEGRRAYMTLWIRSPTHPGGSLGRWRKWVEAPNICFSPYG